MEKEMPERIRRLSVDEKGRPVPYFVQWIEGKPDFRVMDGAKLEACYRKSLCWVCGEKLGVYKAFVIGPMCVINRVSAEPPSHRDCAEYSARACPFLTTPRMHRRERGLPEGVEAPGGIGLKRNPGVTLVWVTRSYWAQGDGKGGVVFRIGPAEEARWFCEGRRATRGEVEESISSGLPILQELALEEGPKAVLALHKSLEAAKLLVPI